MNTCTDCNELVRYCRCGWFVRRAMTADVAQCQSQMGGNARTAAEHLKSGRYLTGGVADAHESARAGGGVPAISSDCMSHNTK